MSTHRSIDRISIAVVLLTLILTGLFMFGKQLGIKTIPKEDSGDMFSDNDLSADWDRENATVISLSTKSVSGNGAYFSGNDLQIVYAGKYCISGTLPDGSIIIDADGDDKIWLSFDNVGVTHSDGAALYVKQADKVFLTLPEGTENTLCRTQNPDNEQQKDTVDGVIYSKDDLTVLGSGKLTVTTEYYHGIVCNDDLVMTGGDISITATEDGIHAHDSVRICNADIGIAAGDDGIGVGNDTEDSFVYIESGNIDITGCYEGIEANDIRLAGGTVQIVCTDDGLNANGDGSASAIHIDGGKLTVLNSEGRDADGLDSNGSIEITGGEVLISLGQSVGSALDYGSENGGHCTISGGSVIACGGSGMAEGFDENSPQGFIMQNVTGQNDCKVVLLNNNKTELLAGQVPYSFSNIVISCPNLKVGDAYSLQIGEQTITGTVDNSSGGMASGGQMSNGDNGQSPPQMPNGDNGQSPPQKPDGDNGQSPPQMPNGDNGQSPPQMPNGENRQTPPEKPDGENGQMPQMPNGENGQTSPQRPDGDNGQMPGGIQNGEFGQAQKPEKTADTADGNDGGIQISGSTLLYIVISAAFLLAGILFAVYYRKKW